MVVLKSIYDLLFQLSSTKDASKEILCLNQLNNKWNRRDVQQINFKNYDLIYAFYTTFPSWGCRDKSRLNAALSLPPSLPTLPHSSKTFHKSMASFYAKLGTHVVFDKSLLDFYHAFLKSLRKRKIKFVSKDFFCSSSKDETPNMRRFRETFGPFSFFFIYFTLFSPVFTFTDFESPLVMFSWWRNKISWDSASGTA